MMETVMTPERWSRLRALLDRALDSPEELLDLQAQLAVDDPALLRDLEALLAQHEGESEPEENAAGTCQFPVR